MLTIQESLNIAAELKLGNHISSEQKRKRVKEIIVSLGLMRVRNTRAGDLSGGQKKRLAIGLELISDPPVMFLDEPTSGLDSSISKHLVYLLHLLARQGRTLVVTMHQPSAGLLQMVDRMYAMVAGRCAYMGSVPHLLTYLSRNDLMCPPYHSPVDFQNSNVSAFDDVFLTSLPTPREDQTLPEQIPVVRREHFNRWYTTGAYYASTLVSTLPTQTVCTLAYACIVYWMTGQPPDIVRFITFCVTLMLVSYVALCVGLLNGSMFNVKNGVVFGPFFIMPFTIFSGFFLRYCDAPFFVRWMFHISFLKHGLVGLVLAIFGMDRPNLLCSQLYCHYKYPKQFLLESDMLDEKYAIVIIALFAISFVVMTLSYIILRIRLKCKW
ncbi:hypothetical protein O3G_MSEX013572 [Manduca sexta]|uniref:Uncharacterized protein n=1 Tax=Manduca sexta TaxID=7130 RepID=A0A921ZT41_MANSE|nr:hypothetical protein O3G_MSEX013572 [Manduca sexta]KAG6462969.1 hypothetical protein O3G_MSEX013572 [Manduca sexta]